MPSGRFFATLARIFRRVFKANVPFRKYFPTGRGCTGAGVGQGPGSGLGPGLQSLYIGPIFGGVNTGPQGEIVKAKFVRLIINLPRSDTVEIQK